jgi:hypothetical protein
MNVSVKQNDPETANQHYDRSTIITCRLFQRCALRNLNAPRQVEVLAGRSRERETELGRRLRTRSPSSLRRARTCRAHPARIARRRPASLPERPAQPPPHVATPPPPAASASLPVPYACGHGPAEPGPHAARGSARAAGLRCGAHRRLCRDAHGSSAHGLEHAACTPRPARADGVCVSWRACCGVCVLRRVRP